jgi:hypothetical protein
MDFFNCVSSDSVIGSAGSLSGAIFLKLEMLIFQYHPEIGTPVSLFIEPNNRWTSENGFQKGGAKPVVSRFQDAGGGGGFHPDPLRHRGLPGHLRLGTTRADHEEKQPLFRRQKSAIQPGSGFFKSAIPSGCQD